MCCQDGSSFASFSKSALARVASTLMRSSSFGVVRRAVGAGGTSLRNASLRVGPLARLPAGDELAVELAAALVLAGALPELVVMVAVVAEVVLLELAVVAVVDLLELVAA